MRRLEILVELRLREGMGGLSLIWVEQLRPNFWILFGDSSLGGLSSFIVDVYVYSGDGNTSESDSRRATPVEWPHAAMFSKV